MSHKIDESQFPLYGLAAIAAATLLVVGLGLLAVQVESLSGPPSDAGVDEYRCC